MSSESSFQDELKARSWQAMLAYAFFRLESALTIALTLVLIFVFPQPFPFWQWWYWLVLGVVAEALIIYTSLTDPATGQRVVADMLRDKYNPATLRNPRYRQRLDQALDYHQRMRQLVRQTGEGVLRDRLTESVDGVDAWIGNMYRLSVRLDAYDGDKVIARDMKVVPQTLAQLQQRLGKETNPEVRGQIQQTLASTQAQWQSLRDLQGTMEKADLQLEKTLSDLGNIYSQLRQIEARDLDSGRAQRIADDITAQVSMLQDIVDSMDQVYSARNDLPGIQK